MSGHKRPRSPEELEPIRLLSPENEAALMAMRDRVSFTSAGCFMHRLLLGRVRLENPKDLQSLLQAHGLTREQARAVVYHGHTAAFPQGDPADADTWNALAALAGVKETTQ